MSSRIEGVGAALVEGENHLRGFAQPAGSAVMAKSNNGDLRALPQTVLNEFYPVAFRKKGIVRSTNCSSIWIPGPRNIMRCGHTRDADASAKPPTHQRRAICVPCDPGSPVVRCSHRKAAPPTWLRAAQA